ncbi:MAG TPA: site-specific integrase, partial [Methylomirabilota bacterium]|nr:site-specific integrase [Methylomirabilota bacterium]
MESVAAYLGALQSERGASRNTLAAYRRDLADFLR